MEQPASEGRTPTAILPIQAPERLGLRTRQNSVVIYATVSERIQKGVSLLLSFRPLGKESRTKGLAFESFKLRSRIVISPFPKGGLAVYQGFSIEIRPFSKAPTSGPSPNLGKGVNFVLS